MWKGENLEKKRHEREKKKRKKNGDDVLWHFCVAHSVQNGNIQNKLNSLNCQSCLFFVCWGASSRPVRLCCRSCSICWRTFFSIQSKHSYIFFQFWWNLRRCRIDFRRIFAYAATHTHHTQREAQTHKLSDRYRMYIVYALCICVSSMCNTICHFN